ncbi:MAG: IS1634 family transposase [Gammaproteobacteria bacterium]|nr:IS1634 family transposase [Gammaproteobacteria bacterium]
MYIRRTTIKSRRNGEPYYTYRLVESIRVGKGVRQRTLLNLGRHFEVPREQWQPLAQRIEQLVSAQEDLLPIQLNSKWEGSAQSYAAMLIQAQAQEDNKPVAPDYQMIDANTLEMIRPRSVAVEHVALSALRQVALEQKLTELGFTRPQLSAAIGTIIGRMVAPGSELATHAWLQEQTGLGELIDYNFDNTKLTRLYRVSDQLLQHKEALEAHLYNRERSLFEFDETITLYDLSNTYFEGTAQGNSNAALGRSKEKRSDCPLVTLALVLDGSGFIKKSEVFAGNASEPKTLAQMLPKLASDLGTQTPTVVLDAGIATEENIAGLKDKHYRYLVVSRKRHREFDEKEAVLVKADGDLRVRVQRIVDPETDEVKLYCHSTQREKKDRGIQELFAKRFEAALEKLAEGLSKKGCVKNYEKVVERIGRLKEKYARAARYYEIRVQQDKKTGKATAIHWSRKTIIEDTQPGVYCLRTNQDQWDEATLWHTYTMLTDLEAVFRSLKSELGLRPVFHQNTGRVTGHLFISVLAYHLVHMIRFQLKACGIHFNWESLRRQLQGQNRVTAQIKRADGRMLHIRKSTRAEPRQQAIYDALGISDKPGRTEKTIV